MELRQLLAVNLKENRRKRGISQAKLAQAAETSAQYIAMIELSRKFPSAEMLERLAAALGICAHELFTAPPQVETELEKLHQVLLADISRVMSGVVESAVSSALEKAVAPAITQALSQAGICGVGTCR